MMFLSSELKQLFSLLLIIVISLAVQGQKVLINEIMSNNTSFVADEDGMYEDWIEIFNAEDTIINLEGYAFTDDTLNRFKWIFPSYQLKPGEYLLIWASGKDRRPFQGNLQNGIYRKYYPDISGVTVADLENSSSFPSNPSSISVVTNVFEAPVNVADNYGQHMHTMIKAPVSGTYRFGISSDDHSELYLSSDRHPENAQLIASVNDWTNVREWTKFSSQTSAEITLTEGELYYLSALMKEGEGGDHLAVRWILPDGTIEEPIKAEHCFIQGGNYHTNFSIDLNGEHLFLIRPDGVTADSIAGVSVPANISYGRVAGTADTWGYFPTPTPGAENPSTAFTSLTTTPTITPEGGVFKSTAVISMFVDDPLAKIYYTTNGSVPSETNGYLYQQPLSFPNTTYLRAVAVSPGKLPSSIASATYSVATSDLFDFESNLPLMVIHSFNRAIVQDNKVPAYMYIVDPHDDGVVELNNNTSFSGRIEIEIRGSSSDAYDKRGYGFHTVEEDGNPRKVSLLGMPEEHNWILHGPYADKSLMRNAVAYAIGEDMGEYAPRTRFVELFLHTGTTKLTKYSYHGVYLLVERIKVDPARVDIEPLELHHNQYPEVSGGYIFKIDRLNSGESGFLTARNSEFVFYRPNEFTITQPQRNYLTSYIDSLESALFGAAFTDENNGYAKFMDVPSFIDMHLITELAKEIDGYRLSTFFHKEREGKLKAGPMWDFNFSLGNADYVQGWNPIGWYYNQINEKMYNWGWYKRMFQDSRFSAQYKRRYKALRVTAFSNVRLLSHILNNQELLREAQERNFNRWKILGTYVWPNYYIADTHEQEVTWMTNWLKQRVAWMDSQLGQPYVMLHYWNFNRKPLITPTWSVEPADIVVNSMGAEIITGTGQEFDAINARAGDPAASHLRINNPLGAEMVFKVSSANYQNLLFSYETCRSQNGPNRHYIDYSTNGTDFIALDTLHVGDTPEIKYIDLASITQANNNPLLAIKITIGYDPADGGGVAGNNRFDNIALDGEPRTGVVRPPLQAAPLKDYHEMITGGDNLTLNMANYFIHPNGKYLQYSVNNPSPDIVSHAINGSNIVFTPVKSGGVTVEIKVKDGVNPPVSKFIYLLVNPTAVPLVTEGYIFSNWSPNQPEGSFPDHMIFLQANSADPQIRTSVPFAYSIPADDYAEADIANLGYPYRNSARSRINGLNANGISFVNTGRDRDVGAVVLALDTRGIDNFVFAFKASTIKANSRVYHLRLQYRVGINSPWRNWMDATGKPVEYIRGDFTGHSQTFGNIPLPPDAAEKPYMQIRWLYYYTGTQLIADNGARDVIALNRIGINETTPVFEYDVEQFDVKLDVNPNPVKDGFICFNKNTSGKLFDINGRLLKEVINHNRIAVHNLKAGIYIYRSAMGETIKIIVE